MKHGFVKLERSNGFKTWVNTNRIEQMYRQGRETILCFDKEGALTVKQSPETILKMLEEQQC